MFAIHKLHHASSKGGSGVNQKLMFNDKGGRGGSGKSDFCDEGGGA